jgi:Zn-dependent peptidase ImmA (M78 family)/transcriptional regulator with XRE-family HTH domain
VPSSEIVEYLKRALEVGFMSNAKNNLKRPADGGPDLAFISPPVLAWALKRSTLSRDFVAGKLKVSPEQIKEWERSDSSSPPFIKAQALAKLLHIPFGFLFLKEEPAADLPLPDFRGYDRSYRASTDLLELLNDILIKQDWYRDHVKESSSRPLTFVGSFDPDDSIADVAADIRLRLGITQQLRQSVSSWGEYLATFTRQTEEAGILVMRSGVVGNLSRRKLKVDELQGFAMADPLAPIVFVNSADFKASQVFTLAHELAHIWIGQSALANASELESGHDRIESFCNRTAAEVLVPQNEFLNAWRHDAAAPEVRVSHVARQFWVSTLVSLRRARELGQISDPDFQRIKTQEQQRRRAVKSSGGDYYRNVIARMSARLTNAVLGDVNNGKLPLRDAARLLGMKVPTLVRFAETWK